MSLALISLGNVGYRTLLDVRFLESLVIEFAQYTRQ